MYRAGLRYLLRHPWQLALSLVGVALGVAVVVAVDLANQSAGRAFEISSQSLTGRTTHQVFGGPRGIPEAWYVALRREHGVRQAAPVIEGEAELPDRPGRSLRVLGVDPLAEGAFRQGFGSLAGEQPLSRLMSRNDQLAMLDRDLRELGLAPGDQLRLRLAGREYPLTVAAALRPVRELDARGLRDVVVMDVGAAQELLGRSGWLDRVDLILEDSAAVERIRALLPADAQLLEAEARNAALQQMTEAFQLNLTAFSLLALMVGAFLIFNTMTFSVVQRRQLLGLLRAVGVTRGQVFRLILMEALLIGAVGTLAGLGLGVAIAHVLLDLVGRTINDLYFMLSISELSLSPWSLGKGLVLGLGMTVIAALRPAAEATATPPRAALSRAVLEQGVGRRVPVAALAGILMACGGGLLVVVLDGLMPAFAGLFLVILGWALVVPLAMRWLLRGLVRPLGRLAGLSGRMAARGVDAGLSRTGVAAAALTVAVAAVVGVGTMVDSFRHTFAAWLDATLRADVYVSVPGNAPLRPEAVDALIATEGVAYWSSARYGRVASGEQRHRLRVFRLPPEAETAFRFRAGVPGEAWNAFREEEVVFLTEPFAYHQALTVGDALPLATPRGERTFRVAAVVYDYSTSEGAIMMSRETYDRFWDDPVVNSLGLYAPPGTDGDALIQRLRSNAGELQPLRYRSNAELRRLSLQVFDQTFTITQVLRLLAMLVAVVGVLSALMALALERAREYAMMRATGFTPGQIQGLILGQNALVGGIAGLLALPLGLVLSAALILVINQRSFGWTMQVQVSGDVLVQAVALSLMAAVVSGLYPAWRMGRTPPGLALREESA
ncbi:MAG: FtsX-like permease family protein [Ectothiorhodospiraceae bacterium]|nr:FtsX-like permease family protein [Ectothiorhodospiraceae bacterium]